MHQANNSNSDLIKAIEDIVTREVKREVSQSETRLKGSMFAMETRLSGEISSVSRQQGKTNQRLDKLESQVEALHNDVKEIYSLI